MNTLFLRDQIMSNTKNKIFTMLIASNVLVSCTSYQKYKIEDSLKKKQYTETELLIKDVKNNKNDNKELVVTSLFAENNLRTSLVKDIKNLISTKNFNEAQKLIDQYKNQEFFTARAIDLQNYLDSVQNNFKNENRSELIDDRLINAEFKNVPITTVIDLLKKNYKINIIFDKDIKLETEVNLNVKKMRIDRFISLLLSSTGMNKKIINKNTLLIYLDTPEKRKEFEELYIKKFNLSYLDVKNAINLIGLFIPNTKQPFTDERSNSITYKDTAEKLKLIESLLKQHDLPDGEVLLDIQIIEIKKSRLTEIGVNFPNSASIGPSKDSSWIDLTKSPLYNLKTGLLTLNMNNLLINLRREVGDFNVLANPSLRVKNKEKAKIMVGDKVPVVSSTTSSTGTITNSINYLDVGIKLEAEPSINANSEVLIKIGLEVSTLAKEIRTTNGDLAYQIGSRNATTILSLKDGETQLLGGLISNEDRSSSNRIPGLGDLPLLGRLFSSQKDDWQNTELVLAVTPHIIHNNSESKFNTTIASGTELHPKLNDEIDIKNIDEISNNELNNNKVNDINTTDINNGTNTNTATNQKNNITNKLNSLKLKNYELDTENKKLELFYDGNTGLSAASFEIKYDINKIKINSIKNGTLFDDKKNEATFIFSNDEKNGILTFGFNKSNTLLTDINGLLLTLNYKSSNKLNGFELRNYNFLNDNGLIKINDTDKND